MHCSIKTFKTSAVPVKMNGLLVLALLLAGALVGCAALLPPPERSYNILMLLPVSSKSHRNVFMPLATALTQRGHKVTMLSNNPPPESNSKIVFLEHGLKHFNMDNFDTFELIKNPNAVFSTFETIFSNIAQDLYDVPVVKDLYKRRKEFDLIIINAMFNEVVYPFAHEHTFVLVSTGALSHTLSASMGNLLNPAYVTTGIQDYPRPLSTLDRFKNVFMHVMMPLLWKKSIQTPAQIEMSKRFPDLPPLSEIERNQSLTLINSHFSMSFPHPLLPNQVEVGGLHINAPKPLPKELADFVSGSAPVVYMSMGSVARSSAMPKEYKDTFFSAFSKLPYKVLWKFEEKPDKDLKNLLVQKWMPQQDILAHPNVKVFISHCGLLGAQEALHFGTPVLGMPIFGDQPKNAIMLENAGVARIVHWLELNEQLLIATIKELIENPTYGKKAMEVSAAMKDRPLSAAETAVYWTEYVVRHQGALHLRSPERDLSWIQVLHLDLIAIVYLVVCGLVFVVKRIFSCCFRSKCRKSKLEKKKKRE